MPPVARPALRLTRRTTLAATLALLSAPLTARAQTPTAAPLKVVATFSVLGDLTQAVGGDAIQLTTLIGPGVDAHTYDPSPADLALLEQADVIVENGLEFEPWLDNFLDSTNFQGERIVASDGVTPRHADESGHEHEEEGDHDEEGHEDEGHEEGHAHGENDPHIWHSVPNAIVMVENIRDGLAAADPDRAAVYTANADAKIADLQALDAWVREQVTALPEDRRKLVTSHDTFGYFAETYGFEIVGTALGSLSTETGDPSARQIADLVAEIQAAGVPAIFAENVTNPALMEAIAAEAGVTLAPPLYSDALGAPGTPGDTYDGMIRSNVETIVQALNA
ncbi:MAG: zinc ABC transporter substrate-binding protein [Thermomicrobiales bacterium]|nr:zinc ABC transporter substrate-binding protein [Thermomicrobiales bacterium]